MLGSSHLSSEQHQQTAAMGAMAFLIVSQGKNLTTVITEKH